MSKKLATVLMVILLCGAGCEKNQKNASVESGVNSSTQTMLVKKDNWQTYKNKEYGFQIIIPQTWSITPAPNGFEINPDVPGPRDDWYAPTKLTILENNPKNKKDSENFSTVQTEAGEQAVVWTQDYGDNKIYEYFFEKQNKIYQFDLMDIQENMSKENEMFKAIVNSFKFIK